MGELWKEGESVAVPSWAESYIDLINNNTSDTGFFWKNVEQFILESAQSYHVNLISNDFTFVSGGTGNIVNARLVTNSMNILNGIATANITSNANGCLLTINSSVVVVPFTDSSGQHNSLYFRVFVYGSNYYFTNYSEGSSQSYSYSEQFSTIESAIQLLANKFRNIDIVVDGEYWSRVSPISTITSNGGGATHIAKVTGQLKDLSSNLADILMVSGGGGGGLIIGENTYAGKDAGGISGSGNNSANQTTGYAFGQGESADGVSGGGSGLYGGYKGR